LARIYYRRIQAGAMVLGDVPERWYNDVREQLMEAGREDLCAAAIEP
jgi:hypothetical protein